MKKLLCLILMLTCLCCTAAFADVTEDMYILAGAVNQIHESLEMEKPFTGASEIEGLGVSFGNDDGTLSMLLIPDGENTGLSTGLISCYAPEQVRNAMQVLCTMSLVVEETQADGLAIANWFDALYDDVQDCFANPEFDADEELPEPYMAHFGSGQNLSATLTVMRLENGPRMDVTFTFDPPLVLPE